MDDSRAGRLIAPKIIWDHEIQNTVVVCTCGSQMVMETGVDVDGRRKAHQWGWWRCLEDPLHITRALPLPVRMARG